MSKEGSKKFLLGAAIGAAAGAIAGILFAPKSGKETRKIIGDKTKEYAEKGKEIAVEGKQVVEKTIENLKK